MSQIQVGIHQPGDSVLHRLPVGAKLLGLMVLSVAIVAIRSMPASWAWLALALVLAVVAGLRLRLLVRATRAVLVIAIVAALAQWWLHSGARAVETLVDLVALALAAIVVTATTPVNAMLDAMVRWLTPLRRLGVDPERVALTFSLAIRSLPGTLAIAQETRAAAIARGLERNPRAYLTPFVIRVVAQAHVTGDALHARGLGD